MRKIKTIFERDPETRKVINKPISDFCYDHRILEGTLMHATATEKLDGTNVRITVRNHTVVRAEKRRNPDKIQKHNGIIEPWYVDCDQYDPQDKYVYDGIKHTDFSMVPDGEHSGELLGPDIQGNPLSLPNNRIVFFLLGQAPIRENVPLTYEGIKAYLNNAGTFYGNDRGIEGIVWHCKNGDMYKIKRKDF